MTTRGERCSGRVPADAHATETHMHTLHLTDTEMRFLQAHMRLAAMNETGASSEMAERILDLCAISNPVGQRLAAVPRDMNEVMNLFIGGTP